MMIPKKQEEEYQKDFERTRARIMSIEEEMAQELERTRKRLEELMEEKKAMLKIYDSLASLLGVENEFREAGREERGIRTSDLPGVKPGKE